MQGRRLTPKDCLACGVTFQPKSSKAKYCGVSCALAAGRAKRFEKSSHRYTSKDGYVYLWINGKGHPEHRLVYEKSRGVKLQTWHLVTHKDGNRSNNDPDNLALRNKDLEELVRRTGKLPASACRATCPKCGQEKTGTHVVARISKNVLYCKPCESERQRNTYAKKVARQKASG